MVAYQILTNVVNIFVDRQQGDIWDNTEDGDKLAPPSKIQVFTFITEFFCACQVEGLAVRKSKEQIYQIDA